MSDTWDALVMSSIFNSFTTLSSVAVLKEKWILQYFNPFAPNAPFLYHLKTSENRTLFWRFLGVEERYIRNE